MDKEARRAQKRRSYARRGQTLRARYTRTRNAANTRGLAFTLTQDEYKALVSQPCAYAMQEETGLIIGLDRKDSAQGYTPANCVPCCSRHNMTKSNVFTYEQMLDAARRYGIRCGNMGQGRKRKANRERMPDVGQIRPDSGESKGREKE